MTGCNFSKVITLGIQHAKRFKCHPRDRLLLEAREGKDRVHAMGGDGARRALAGRWPSRQARVRCPGRNSISYPVAEVWKTPHKQGSSLAGAFRALGESSGVTPWF